MHTCIYTNMYTHVSVYMCVCIYLYINEHIYDLTEKYHPRLAVNLPYIKFQTQAPF